MSTNSTRGRTAGRRRLAVVGGDEDLRRAADALQRGGAASGFRRQRSAAVGDAEQETIRRAVTRAQGGDREAMGFLYTRYADNVYGYVRTIVRDDHEAADVTQRVFTKLLTAIKKYEDRGRGFTSWLMRLAHNVAVDHIRSRSAIPSDHLEADERSHDDSSTERVLSVRAALHALPDDQRNVVVLRHLVGLSPSEIAQRLGRSESSVHGLHHRGRRTLQEELTRMGCGPSIACTGARAA